MLVEAFFDGRQNTHLYAYTHPIATPALSSMNRLISSICQSLSLMNVLDNPRVTNEPGTGSIANISPIA